MKSKTWTFILLVSSAPLLAGCGSIPEIDPARQASLAAIEDFVPPSPPTFDAARHIAYQRIGPGVIEGQAFLRQRGGGVVTCAGSVVLLVPDTPYFRDALLASMFVIGTQPSVDPRAQTLVHNTMCDASGNFSFAGIPPGKWVIATNVNWEVASESQGGGLLSRVIVENTPLKILMTEVYSWP